MQTCQNNPIAIFPNLKWEFSIKTLTLFIPFGHAKDYIRELIMMKYDAIIDCCHHVTLEDRALSSIGKRCTVCWSVREFNATSSLYLGKKP